MKRKTIVLLAILSLLSGTIACSYIANVTSPLEEATPAPNTTPETLFEEKEFTETGCFYDSSTDEIQYFVEEGAFHIDVLVPEWYALSPCLGKDDFTDFILEVDATQVAGPDHNLYGIMLRYNDSAREYYYFAISGDGNYTLVFDNLDAQEPTTKLIHWTPSSAIKTGASTNHIKIVAVGNTFELYVNDQLLDTIHDERISSGTVGFVVATSEEGGAHIKFDNIMVTAP